MSNAFVVYDDGVRSLGAECFKSFLDHGRALCGKYGKARASHSILSQ